ncbi:MAG: lysophospholipase [Anaerolineaceae bacterium 4572_5.1]|nr:MAG: lysophospholipase [Anaerolineaceae bacterium 4572_5.1]
MKTEKWDFKTNDGLNLYAFSWTPEKAPKALICLVHGHGEHIERYAHVAAAMNEAGYALMGFDHRGHGQSEGARGHTPSYDALLDDISAFLTQAEERYPNLPRFLYGHSMGGNLVLNYALRRKPTLKGVIATGPWIKLAFEPPAIQVFLGKTMNKIYPAFIQASGLETAAISRDPNEVSAYENDPLVHDKISARLFVGMYEAGLWSLEHAAEFPLPLLLMHGSADRLTSAEASRQFAEAAGDAVTLKVWDGWYHEIHNEPEKAEVFKTTIEWLDAQ